MMAQMKQLHTSVVVKDMGTGAEDAETTDKLVKKATRTRKPKAAAAADGEAKPKTKRAAASGKAKNSTSSKKKATVGEDGKAVAKKPKKKAAPSEHLAG